MLQWFNKQSNSSSSLGEPEDKPQYSSSDDSVLTKDNYEFLFNQLLEGVAHGWHLGRTIKFFDDLESRSTLSQWVAWLKEFEQRIVYGADPSQRRVGAIMMRLGEITQSNEKLKEFGSIAYHIGKRLFIGSTKELIWEYDGLDRVTEDEDSTLKVTSTATQEIANETTSEEIVSDTPTSRDESEENLQSLLEIADQTTSEEIVDREITTEQPTISPDLVPEPESEENIDSNSIKSLEALTEQLTVLQDENFESEAPTQIDPNQQPITDFTEQPTLSPDFTPEPKSQELKTSDNSLESLEALTEQLTVLQDDILERDPSSTFDSESTLVAPENKEEVKSTPLSVASFLEATKALVPEQRKQNTITPLTWEEFISLLEQDEILARQVAQHLKIPSTNPHEILQVAVERFTKQEDNQLSPGTIELVESWFNLGLKQASAEDFQGAISSWEKALKLNPDVSEAWHNRGSALGRLGKYTEAIKSFDRAIRIAPERYQAWNDRAHALYQVQEWEQAVESWDKAISIMSDNYQFWYNRGCALEQLERFNESISSYEKALEIKPDFQSARSRYINLITEHSSSSPNSL